MISRIFDILHKQIFPIDNVIWSNLIKTKNDIDSSLYEIFYYCIKITKIIFNILAL
jgi:hypothetical protein